MDSVAAVDLSGELEDWLKIQLSPMVAWKYSTPATLADYLAQQADRVDSQQHLDAEEPQHPPEDQFQQLLKEIESLSEREAADLANGEVAGKGDD